MVELIEENSSADYVINARWVMEGILLPFIGSWGIGGRIFIVKDLLISFLCKYQYLGTFPI